MVASGLMIDYTAKNSENYSFERTVILATRGGLVLKRFCAGLFKRFFDTQINYIVGIGGAKNYIY